LDTVLVRRDRAKRKGGGGAGVFIIRVFFTGWPSPGFGEKVFGTRGKLCNYIRGGKKSKRGDGRKREHT